METTALVSLSLRIAEKQRELENLQLELRNLVLGEERRSSQKKVVRRQTIPAGVDDIILAEFKKSGKPIKIEVVLNSVKKKYSELKDTTIRSRIDRLKVRGLVVKSKGFGLYEWGNKKK